MVTIGRATAQDAAALLAIQRRAFEEEARRLGTRDILPLTEPLEAFLEHVEKATVLIARIGDRIVGGVRGIVSEGVCTIRGLCVEPEFHGRGIGTDLLQAIEDAHPHVRAFALRTNTVMPSNVAFYRRHGYAVVEVRQVADSITLAFMRKPAADVK